LNDNIPFELESERLRIRPFHTEDLTRIHDILNQAFESETTLDNRRSWLNWSIHNYRELASLYQPPYGDYALVLKATDELIGSVGLVQCIGPFDVLPYYQAQSSHEPTGLATTEMGLFWAIDPAHQHRGYATEGARLLIRYAFENLWLKRIIATTEFDNEASIGVMRRLEMTIERNPYNEPFWFQVVGILENPARPLKTRFTFRTTESQTQPQTQIEEINQ
jgi:[ribosomal protein S5]-alanine N-acetyltransferase